RNVLGVVRTSAQAPGPASLRDYINLLEFVKPSIAVTPLVDGNAVRALQDVGTLTRLTLAVGPDVSPQAFNRSRMIFDVIQSMRRDLGEVAIEITVKISPKGQHEAANEAYRQISDIVTSDAVGFADKAEIAYRRLEDGKATTHDFIEEAVTQAVVIDVDDR